METNFAYALIKERVIRECDVQIISFLKTQRAKTVKRAGGWRGDRVKGGEAWRSNGSARKTVDKATRVPTHTLTQVEAQAQGLTRQEEERRKRKTCREACRERERH